jgi:hypothetical protein
MAEQQQDPANLHPKVLAAKDEQEAMEREKQNARTEVDRLCFISGTFRLVRIFRIYHQAGRANECAPPGLTIPISKHTLQTKTCQQFVGTNENLTLIDAPIFGFVHGQPDIWREQWIIGGGRKQTQRRLSLFIQS